MATIYKDGDLSLSHSKEKDPSANNYILHVHEFYEVLCFVAGNADYLVEGRKYHMYPGCIMIMRPAEIHKLAIKGKGTYERYVLEFRVDTLKQLGFSEDMLAAFTKRELGEKNQYLPNEFPGFDTIGFFKQLEEECGRLDGRQTMMSNISFLLCALNLAFLKKSTDTNTDTTVGKELISYVNENLTRDISLSSVSEYVHMSPSQVNRIFKRLTGTSVYDYILSKRLVMVREMIEAGEGAVAASQMCGFGDYSSFYRLYKKRTGQAPGDVKKNIRS